MRQLIKSSDKKARLIKTPGRFASPEELAQAKNADLVAQIKKIGLKVIKTNSSK